METIPAPNAAVQARIEAALAALAAGGEPAGVAVRELALVGEPALPAIVERLNAAGPAERLLLLSAARGMPRAAPLVERARTDPHPAVRAWAATPPPRERPGLRRLATRYLDLLAVAEVDLRRDAEVDQKDVPGRLGRPPESFLGVRNRLRDKRYASSVRRMRRDAATDFAIAGAEALRGGTLRPDLGDPVFLAYVGLLREEGIAFYYAIKSLVAVGEPLVPVCEELLKRENHDAAKLVRVLFTVRSDGGLGVYDRFASFRPDVQRRLLRLSPRFLPRGDLVPFCERAALSDEETVRTVALDALLDRPAPAGLAPARKLLDASKYKSSDFMRAAKLLARAGEFDPLLAYLDVKPAREDSTEPAQRLRSLRRAAMNALRAFGTPELGRRLLASKERDLRIIGIDLIHDGAELLEHAKREEDPYLAGDAAVRGVGAQGGAGYEDAIRILDERKLRLGSLINRLRRAGSVAGLIAIAGRDDPEARRRAFGALADLEQIPVEHEAALLGLHDRWPEALEALLPLGTAEAERRFLAATEIQDVIGIARARAEQSLPLPFALPVREWMKDADADRLLSLTRIAESLPKPDPGLFRALLRAWDALPDGQQEAKGLDAGAAQQKILLLDALAYSKDETSAELLFDDLLEGRLKTPSLILGVLKAAARHVDESALAKVLPKLRAFVAEEHPIHDNVAPPYSATRADTLRGGIHALAYRRVAAALPFLTDTILDPELYGPAFDRRHESWVPWTALNALRLYPGAAVAREFRAGLARAGADGRLARLDPERLYGLLRQCREGRRYGRSLPEVGLALAEVLERLPFEADIEYQKMRNLATMRRHAAAARIARELADRRAGESFTAFDGFWTPDRLRRRAGLYEAIAAGDKAGLRRVVDGLGDDDIVLSLAAHHLCFSARDPDLAEDAAKRAVHATAGLYRHYRDLMGAVCIARGDAASALFWLDPSDTLSIKRNARSRRHLLYTAQARVLNGELTKAGFDLENGLAVDRRFLREAKTDPRLKDLAPVFERA
ncbi:MAG: hypothetical protein OER88_08705, partial [Planctomycetota bacterium]|nr:hypothetical protein [Planctomycetota bacterium]